MTPSSEELLSCCVYVFDCVCLYTVSIMKYQVVAIQKNKQKSFVFFVPRQRETYRLTSLVCHVVAPLRGAGARRALTSTAPRAHGRRGAAQNDTRSPGDHARRAHSPRPHERRHARLRRAGFQTFDTGWCFQSQVQVESTTILFSNQNFETGWCFQARVSLHL